MPVFGHQSFEYDAPAMVGQAHRVSKMQRFLLRSSAIAFALASVIVVDEWLASQGAAAVYARITFIVAVAVLGAFQWRRFSRCETRDLSPADKARAMCPDCEPVNQNLVRELALAIEHIQSIRILLEISSTHQQPIPRAVPANLSLVAKHLRKACIRLSTEKETELIQPLPEPAACGVRDLG
jgi:hypothetical protein